MEPLDREGEWLLFAGGLIGVGSAVLWFIQWLGRQ
jgi:hypothetical protein